MCNNGESGRREMYAWGRQCLVLGGCHLGHHVQSHHQAGEPHEGIGLQLQTVFLLEVLEDGLLELVVGPSVAQHAMVQASLESPQHRWWCFKVHVGDPQWQNIAILGVRGVAPL